MKTYMPLDGFRWSCDSDSALCDILQTNVFGRTGGGYPIVLWELSLIAVQSYYFLLKYLLRHSHSPQFNVLCQEKQQGICKHSS